jgi:phosphoacetylglucosamine mutase
MDYKQWLGIYTELPSKQVKLAVPDKNALKCSEDETYLLSPSELQHQLDRLMKTVDMGRIFIRPSGTEDVVRIYAEATRKEDVDTLVAQTKELINAFYQGHK